MQIFSPLLRCRYPFFTASLPRYRRAVSRSLKFVRVLDVFRIELCSLPIPSRRYCCCCCRCRALLCFASQAVPKSDISFALRQPLATPWLGLRDEELSKVSGIEGGVFVHVNGFVGGNASKEGALAMASKSLEMAAAAATASSAP